MNAVCQAFEISEQKVRASSFEPRCGHRSLLSINFLHTPRNFSHSWLVPSSSYLLANQLSYIRKQPWSSSRRSRTSTSRRSLPPPRTMPYLPTMMMMMTTQTRVRLFENYVVPAYPHNVCACDILHGSNTNPDGRAAHTMKAARTFEPTGAAFNAPILNGLKIELVPRPPLFSVTTQFLQESHNY